MNIINIGDRFGKLTILESKRTRIKNSYYYKVKCDCGKEYYVQCSSIKSGRTTMCKKCSSANKRLTIPLGYKFGTWEVISKGVLISKQWRYLVRCTCGNTRYMPASQIMNHHKYNTCLRCSAGRILSNFRESFINNIKKNAFSRGKDFAEDVTPEYLYSLLESQDFKCALTGDDLLPDDNSLDHLRRDLPLSLDRINSSKGYIRGNVQWVTKQVNLMKGAMTMEELLNTCSKILNHANQQPSQPLTKLEGSETND